MSPARLLGVATQLALTSENTPEHQERLRRAVSTAYYATFHALANSNANTLIGTPANSHDSEAWNRTHRALEHGIARSRPRHNGRMASFPNIVRKFADMLNGPQSEGPAPTRPHTRSPATVPTGPERQYRPEALSSESNAGPPYRGEMDMDSHGVRAGWPFDRRVDFSLGERLQLKAGAVGKEGGPGESPGKRMNGWRRMGWANEGETTGAERASVGRRLPAEGAPIVIDLDVSSGYPIVLGQVDGRTMIRWPLTVRDRPPSPHRTMFSDEYHYDAGGWLHRDGGPAIVFSNGARVWMQHGAPHRAGGPAVEGGEGPPAWYRHGRQTEPPE